MMYYLYILALCAFSAPANAFDGNDLLDICEHPGDARWASGYCLGFIIGATRGADSATSGMKRGLSI